MSLLDFFAALALAVSTYYFENVDPARKPPDVLQSDVLESYDFIIVGAGSAGSVLAHRLTEVPDWKVLLIEGGSDEDAVTDAPALNLYLQGTRYDWNYTTTPQANVCQAQNGTCPFPRGFVMGGSSTINSFFYVRGNHFDYNEWEYQANPGWSFKDIMKYFIKLESLSIPRIVSNLTLADMSLRGFFGPMTIQYGQYFYSITDAVLSAAIEAGLVQGSYNGVTQQRVDYSQSTVNGPSRQSASRAYLNPIRLRKNLNVIRPALVTNLLFNGSNAVSGVQYVRNGQMYRTYATKEVILSAGVINTPQLLMLSGIGPAEDLNASGIAVVNDLPVGRNLQDHLVVTFLVNTNRTAQLTEEMFFSNQSIIDYALLRRGPLTSTVSELIAFKAYANETLPNGSWFVAGIPSPNNSTDVFGLGTAIVKPKSRGTVKLNSTNPTGPPLIDPQYLTEHYDRTVLREALSDVLSLLNRTALRMFNATIDPNLNQLCADYILLNNQEALIDCLIANQSTSYYNAVGTARMGPATDTNSVVNANLTVHGMDNLRVIDASIMPNITRGNTNGPTLMIAEKGADLIKFKYGAPIIPVVPVPVSLFT